MLTDAELTQWAQMKAKPSPLVPISIRIPKVFHDEALRICKKEGIKLPIYMRRAMARDFLGRRAKP